MVFYNSVFVVGGFTGVHPFVKDVYRLCKVVYCREEPLGAYQAFYLPRFALVIHQ